MTFRDNNPGDKKEKKLGWKKPTAVLALAGAALFGAACSNESAGAHNTPSSPVATSEANPGAHEGQGDNSQVFAAMEQASMNEFWSNEYTDIQRVDWAYNQLHQPSSDPAYQGMTLLEAGYKQMAAEYNKPGMYQYVGNYVKPSESMSGNDILTLNAVIGYIIKNNTTLSDNDRVKLLGASVDSDYDSLNQLITAAFNRDSSGFGGIEGVDISSVNNQPVMSKVFRTKKVPEINYDPAGIPSVIINGTEEDITGGPGYQSIFRFIDGKPVLYTSYPSNSDKARTINPQDIHD